MGKQATYSFWATRKRSYTVEDGPAPETYRVTSEGETWLLHFDEGEARFDEGESDPWAAAAAVEYSHAQAYVGH